MNWNAPSATNVEIHVNSPDGPTLTGGGPTGGATTGQWVTDGMQFFLQDVSNSLPLTSANTLAVITAHLTTATTTFDFTGPIVALAGSNLGTATLQWNAPGATTVEIHVNTPDGPMLTRAGTTGTAVTAQWVTEGMQFYLQNVTGDLPLTSANTLGVITAHLTSQ